MAEKATLNIDPEVHKKLKIEAAKREMGIGELAEQLIEEGLEREKRKKEK